MNQIHLLDTATINKIAAGEVVERPASVIKELIENSIDADSSSITVEISDGGISKIRVTDNGSGIENDQVKLAFLNHSTSKIQNVDDIFNINSLGFRGEALASIAAVSQLEITTKTKTSLIGKHMEIHGGNIKVDEDIGCPNGTTIIVKNLFYNTPARQKFLKKPSTEAGYISDIITQMAFGHPNINFKFINNNKLVLNCFANNNLKNSVLSIYGKEFVSKLLEVDFKKYNFGISGLICKPELARSNRGYENLFVNKRYIKNDIIRDAVENAYKTKIMGGKYPIFILNLEVPPNEYDVNVHPTKLEVRFEKEYEIYDLVYTGVLEALKTQDLIPKIDSKPSVKQKKEVYSQQSIPIIASNKSNIGSTESNKIKHYVSQKTSHNLIKEDIPKEVIEDNSLSTKEINKPEEALTNHKQESKLNLFTNYKIIGQAFNTYIFIEIDESIYIIDQHAAHERVLYEQFINSYKNNKFNSQILIQPLLIKLNLKEKQRLIDNLKLFEDMGFQIEEFGESDCIIRSVPIIFNKPENVDFLVEILDFLNDNFSNSRLDLKLDKIATISCKAAVKAHNKLSNAEIDNLISNLMNLDNPFNCPHGRPTIIEMTKYEIEKKFKRIV